MKTSPLVAALLVSSTDALTASQMAQIATLKFTQNDTQDVAYFEPYYLKDFVGTTPKKLL